MNGADNTGRLSFTKRNTIRKSLYEFDLSRGFNSARGKDFKSDFSAGGDNTKSAGTISPTKFANRS